MADKYFSDQFEDEEMLLLFRKHPIVMRREIVIASVLLLLGTVPALIKPTYAYFFGGLAIGFILATLVMFYAWIGWYFSVFIVTDQRLLQMSQRGLFKRSVVDIGLDKIQTISYEVSGLQETLLGFGTIVIQTYVGELVIHDVHHPKNIQNRMSHILRELGYHSAVPPMLENQND
ncbi:MAG TPA: PH domain-containing protein [Patescibacteria group bacterium]|nr:PH domain-containing protein [Patescibacteria group bacterium]